MFDWAGDFRFGVRLLRKSPVFAATAVLLLAIGIGSNTLIFSAVNALLLRPLPVRHPENLVRIVEVHPKEFVTWDLPYDFCGPAANDPDFAEVICQGESDVPFRDGTATERIRVHFVSPNFFSSLGVSARAGRVLTSADERSAATNAVLSYPFWRRRFQGSASVLGRRISLGGHPFTIVGVTPQAFNGLAADTSPDIRVPASVDRLVVPRDPDIGPLARPVSAQIFARLRSGVLFERANAELDARLHAAYQHEADKLYPPAKGLSAADDSLKSRLRLESIANGVSTLRPQFSRGLQILMAGVALLVVMACANVAGLLLARSTVRAQEFGIRLALGASRTRILRQLFAEGLILAVLGGLAGTVLTLAGLPLAQAVLPPVRDRGAVLQPVALRIDLDGRVLAFAILVTFATAILFALSPGLHSAFAGTTSLSGTTRTMTRRLPARNLIVGGQVAIATLTLMGAGVLVRTLERMRSLDPGFDRDHVVTFTIDPAVRGYRPDQARALSKGLLEKAKVLPGVEAAGLASRAVMRGTGMKSTLGAAGARIGAADFLNSSSNSVTPGYFDAMGMHILTGRDFTSFDRNPGTPKKAIVNQAFAKRFFSGRNPLGGRFGFAGPGGIAQADKEIVGVVSDAKYRSLREPIPPTAYSPVVDGFEAGFVLHVRTRQRPELMIEPVRKALESLDPELPPIEIRTLHDEVEASLWQERLLAWFSGIFAAAAALLASIGLYGALDYAVKSRTREIGVRLALGAAPAQIAALLSRETLGVLVSGVAMGLVSYAAAASWIRRALFEVRSWDPAAVASALGLVVLMGAAAAIAPAVRAMLVNPASALRAE